MFFGIPPVDKTTIDAINRTRAGKSRRPVANLGNLFVTRMELMKAMRSHVLGETGITLGKAQILIELYGAKELPQWRPKADDEGYLALRRLRDELVHDVGQLTRTIGELEREGLIEVWFSRNQTKPGVPRNGKAIRVTERGAKLAGHIWRRYWTMADELLKGVSDEDLAAHIRVNEAIRRNCRAPMFDSPPLDGLAIDEEAHLVPQKKGRKRDA